MNFCKDCLSECWAGIREPLIFCLPTLSRAVPAARPPGLSFPASAARGPLEPDLMSGARSRVPQAGGWAGRAGKSACAGRAGNVTGEPARAAPSLWLPRRARARAPPHAPPLPPAPPAPAPGLARAGGGGGRRKAGGGGGGRGRGGAGPARRGSARPPVRGSRSAPGPARAAAAALARGLGGTRAPRRSHGPGDPAALADAQRRLLRQQQRGEPGPAEQPPRQAWAASAGRRAPGGEGAAASERAGRGLRGGAVRPRLGSRTGGSGGPCAELCEVVAPAEGDCRT